MAFASVPFSFAKLWIDKYCQLKENKIQFDYRSLYSFFNKALIPSQFQEEMGIPKLVYNIGEHFPFVFALSDRLQSANRIKSKDDSCVPQPSAKTKKMHKLFFSHSERQSPEVLVDSPRESLGSLGARKGSLCSEPEVLKETAPNELETKSSLMRTYQSTKERIVNMLLNINEKVSPKGKRMKEESKVRVKVVR